MDPSRYPDTASPETLEAALAEACRERDALQRRLQVEAALERVRARAMAMHHSDELGTVVATVYEQFQNLDFDAWGCALVTCNDDRDGWDMWISTEQSALPVPFAVPYLDDPVQQRFFEAWRQDPSFQVLEFGGEEKKTYDRRLFDETDWKHLPATMKDLMQAQEHVACAMVVMPHSVLEAVGPEPLPDDKAAILKRFAHVFEQSYTRFLDLKQAEAQAREAQIEAALERVRARAMAMHRSDELGEAAQLLYQEMVGLGITPWACGYIIIDEAQGQMDVWDVVEGGLLPLWVLPLDLDTVIRERYLSWKRQEPLHCLALDHEATLAHTHAIGPFVSMDLEELLSVLPERIVFYSANFSEGQLLLVTTSRISSEQERILVRFARVFEQTYTRFLDLKKAEEQAREAQIEAALERVRARSMAMHHSDELREVAAVFYEQLKPFGLAAWGCEIIICNEASGHMEYWFADPTQPVLQECYTVPFQGHPVLEKQWNAWKDGIPLLTTELVGEEMREFNLYLFEQTDFKNLPKAVKEAILGEDFSVFSHVSMKHGLLGAIDVVPIADDKAAILKRFARVFDQTYTRFLDLQQAEAQAREAQVEAALERVRARTMGMHKSGELREVVSVLYEQLDALGLADWGCSIMIFDKASNRIEYWVAESTGSDLNSYYVEGQRHPVYKKLWTLWEQQGPPLTLHHTDEVKREFDEYWLYETDFKALPEEVRSSVLNEREIFLSYISMRHGLLSAYGYQHLPDEKIAILQRFSNVFDQTYTRFLDLQQAETQAREARIEAALERVRARAMAMHSSDELLETAAVLFQQLDGLGIEPWRCGIGVFDKEKKIVESWSVTTLNDVKEVRVIGYVEITGHPIGRALFAAWQNQEPLHSYDLSGAAVPDYFSYVTRTLPLPEGKASTDALPERLVYYHAFFTQGTLYGAFLQPLPEAQQQFLQRFAQVFEQTYTRFLDLKKAEGQAREAQIEAALERVRARTMGMHHSDELLGVVAVMFKEMEHLGFEPTTCSIGLFDAETLDSVWWQFDETQSLIPHGYRVPYFDHPWWKAIISAWQDRVPFMFFEGAGEEKKRFDAFFFTETDAKNLPEASKAMMIEVDRSFVSYASMNHGVLEINTDAPLPDDKADILQRFAKVIDLTYTRFDDLQQAEARAREAVRAASLDRVRAEIASMRTADDLRRITPLVWRELTTLGVPFFRCGVFIVDEAAQNTHTYLSTPDGTALAALHLPFESTSLIEEVVAHWRRRQVYTQQWDRDQFVAWVATLVEQGHLDGREAYQGGEAPPERLALHFLPFTQGMLYVGSAAPLTADQIDLVQALADAFSVAYARYEDFTRLEAAKQRVEAALADLKATQAQLIHAEKMASLGQMTAGIAHEIKNPLNFVNNFAEVNEELAEELTEELHKLDAYLPGDAAEDFKEALAAMQVNAASIARHGRRADDIVKSMMQHAREGTGTPEPTAINALVEEYVNLAFHGIRASQPGFTAEIERDYSEAVGQAPVLSQELGRVLMNLLSNAFYAVDEHAGRAADGYTPTVTVATRAVDAGIEIRVRDNGPGIPPDVKEKIFEPFFTTKPTGEGTGLGLSLSYDIVTQGHGGTLTVESAEGKGATFIVTLPVNQTETPST